MTYHDDERFLARLARDLRARMSPAERARDERDADAFAQRAALRLAIRRVEESLPRRAPRYRDTPMVATVSQSVLLAAADGCAPLLDLAAAAGAGRALWDEPCDAWLELPADLPPSRYVALRVAGDSMDPVLASRDVMLVKLDTAPCVNDLVVARLPDDGFVVKRVAALANGSIELASFNSAYDPIVVPRDQVAILGTVIARFARE